MRSDLRAKLVAIAQRPIAPKSPVTPVSPVTCPSGYRSEPLRLQRLQALQGKSDKRVNDENLPGTSTVTSLPEPDQAECDERARWLQAAAVPAPLRRLLASPRPEDCNDIADLADVPSFTAQADAVELCAMGALDWLERHVAKVAPEIVVMKRRRHATLVTAAQTLRRVAERKET